MGNCKAQRYGDQMMCVCGLAWDVKDPDQPTCRTVTPQQRIDALRARYNLKKGEK